MEQELSSYTGLKQMKLMLIQKRWEEGRRERRERKEMSRAAEEKESGNVSESFQATGGGGEWVRYRIVGVQYGGAKRLVTCLVPLWHTVGHCWSLGTPDAPQEEGWERLAEAGRWPIIEACGGWSPSLCGINLGLETVSMANLSCVSVLLLPYCRIAVPLVLGLPAA
ncbi:hypothetical protein PAAG_03091 [Paracoccidioides lutzii Pb01]|uniref:Uncharacterized protein n=1 Tax=Paracoccidioides lutzii (strain ATCC MYA-826 / Pb01) TaxID=502779 RepID=C1GYD7_PARBA|nr:hypothetical protein PAAG_03091 [Paracoccidioides lutzii Pb01]EEH41529.2 hypothetical protein PAAG_03091 [Paracoccidioides lutzii Pb01]